MKNIIATSIALLTATSAMAVDDTLKWQGVTGTDLHGEWCALGSVVTGNMTYNATTKKWLTTKSAKIVVTARKISNVKVESQGQLYKSNSATTSNVTVDLNDSWVDVTGAGADDVRATKTLSPTTVAEITGGFPTSGPDYTILTITLGGTATVTNPETLIEDSAYQVHHKVTCTL